MSDLTTTTSSIAIIERWNRRKQLQHLDLQLIHWMLFYIPRNLVLIRPLVEAERQWLSDQGLDYEGDEAYGAFVARTGEWLAHRASCAELVAEAVSNRYAVTYLQ
jgi:hypothetical protein